MKWITATFPNLHIHGVAKFEDGVFRSTDPEVLARMAPWVGRYGITQVSEDTDPPDLPLRDPWPGAVLDIELFGADGKVRESVLPPRLSEVELRAASVAAVQDAIETDTGYDVVLLLGQSNQNGQGTPDTTNFDVPSTRVWQYAANGTNSGQIVLAADPLAHPSGTSGLGPGTTFAQWYAQTIPSNRRVLLVPCARGGTPFEGLDSLGTTFNWKVSSTDNGTNLYKNAIRLARGALAAAGPNARLVAALWFQGESDAINGTSAATYRTDLEALIDQLRADLSAPTLPVLIAQMLPATIDSTPAYAAIDGVHAATPTRKSFTAYARSPYKLDQGDGLHFNSPAQRIIGRNLALTLPYAQGNTAPGTSPTPAAPTAQPTALTIGTISGTTVQLSWARAVDAVSYLPEYQVQGSSTWVKCPEVTALETTLNGLPAGVIITFRVSARNAAGSGPASTTAALSSVLAASLPVTSGLAAWFKADLGVTLSGTDVMAWADQSGQGNNLSPTTNKTTVNPTGINGKPALVFTGTQGLLSATATGLAQQSTIFVVEHQATQPSTDGTMVLAGSSTGGRQYRIDGTGYQRVIQSNTADVGSSGSTVPPAAAHVLAVRFDASNTVFFKDGAEDATLGTPPTFNNTGLQIGMKDGSDNFTGSIGEVIVYGRALTDTEMTQVSQYLGSRFAVTVAG